jgi:hypothetical protein
MESLKRLTPAYWKGAPGQNSMEKGTNLPGNNTPELQKKASPDGNRGGLTMSKFRAGQP